ncbi:amino acid ABC transporter permease [Tianweitania populi]|uniref:ABC transporter permease n=1 Tax=Tianweitania populi TaxID=1607949 RepID=A0A8J3DZV4_9HYPH|nr:MULTISPECIES: amino acid ABC transporter permease [Tianweitania]GHD19392.1 ABC transporter permease [Tianweitania populi]
MFRTFGFEEFWFILLALRWTIALTAIAFAGGMVGGLVVALARTSALPMLRYPAVALIRVFQGTPLLMQLFLVFFGLNLFGFKIDPWFAAAAAFTLHASAFLGEIWRGCIEAVPRGQFEASWALGLGYKDRNVSVILPQAARIAVAPTVGFLVQLLKGTSLASIIGFIEITRAGQVVNNMTFQPMVVFSVVAAMYFALCWPLSLFAKRMERQFSKALAR